jgi:MFS family permease
MGRKPVLVFGFLAIGLLTLGLTWAGADWRLTLLVGALGLFVYSLQAIILAAAMDVTGRGVEATTVGFFFTGTFLFSAFSPLIAGYIIGLTESTRSAFYYVGSLMLLAAFLVSLLPLRRQGETQQPEG